MATVEEALKIGADGVSNQVNVGAEDEARKLATLGETSRWCQEWGMPLLAMMYPRGKKIEDEPPDRVHRPRRQGGGGAGGGRRQDELLRLTPTPSGRWWRLSRPRGHRRRAPGRRRR